MIALTSQPAFPRSPSEQHRILHADIDNDEEKSSVLGLPRLSRRHLGVLRACSGSTFILLAAILIGLSVSLISFKLTGWSSAHEHEHKRRMFHHYFVKKASHSTAAVHLEELTRSPHVAGSLGDFTTAVYVKATFEKYGMKAHYRDYEVLLSFPEKRSLSLIYSNGSELELPLKEMPAKGDFNSTSTKAIPPFHAYSPSGFVLESVVYVNYGHEEDYKKLEDLGVNVSGVIAIARYGETFRGDVVAIAASKGVKAVILYSDPKDYGSGGESGYYPEAAWLPPTGVQRGTVFRGIGDPLTPGWPSISNGEKLSNAQLAKSLPKIPSLPISAADAEIILSSLGGPIAPPEWHGSLPMHAYHVGKEHLKLKLDYKAVQKIVNIRNVFAVIEGSIEPDRYVLLGNHRDAWTFGAVDPSSGTAALLEIARRFRKLVRHGWRPRRSLVLCSWDAEEYGMIGSTEWVEQNSDLLAVKVVAYLNVDCAVAGPGFFAASTPQLDSLLKEITKEVKDPDTEGMSIHDTWVISSGDKPMVSRLGGGGSDFVSFLHHIGVPSVDIYFGKGYSVYHSLYDTFQWMEKFGDPTFKRLTAASTIWGLAALRLADDVVIPFDYSVYVHELQLYTKAVEKRLLQYRASTNVTVAPIWSSIKFFVEAVTYSAQEGEILSSLKIDTDSSIQLTTRARILNDRLMMTERAFIDSDGLKGRTWFKHLVYSPSQRNEYGESFFPGINAAFAGAIDGEGWDSVQHEIWRVARVIDRAATVLKGQLT